MNLLRKLLSLLVGPTFLAGKSHEYCKIDNVGGCGLSYEYSYKVAARAGS